MKWFSLVAFAVALLLVFVAVAMPRAIAQVASQCNQGVLIRSDSSVTIDTWTDYRAGNAPANPTQTAGALLMSKAPSRITLGTSLPDSLPIRVETGTGAVDVTLAELRKLAASRR